MQNSGQATSPAGAAVQMAPVTTGTLVLIVLAAIATVLMIWWGARLLRARRDAIDTLEDDGRIDRVDPETPVGGRAADASEPHAARSDTPAAIKGDTGDVAVAAAPGLEPVPVVVPTAPSPPPIADAPTVATAPEAVVAPAAPPEPPAPADADDLTRLKGVGPKVATQLAELGVTRYADLAALSPAEAEALDARLGTFRGRMTRDRWIDQARYLAQDDRAGFEAEFGKL